jgi:hypothetical protein
VDSHIACRSHAVPLPCRAAKGLECVFPIWLTQCGCVWFTLYIFMNQTRPHCVNQMGKTHSKHLAARHGRGRAWARHAMCESAYKAYKDSYIACRAHAIPLPCRATKGLECLSHLIYTVRPCLIHKNVKCKSDTAALCK